MISLMTTEPACNCSTETVTVTLFEILEPSVVVAEITAVPGFMAVTRPLAETEATLALVDNHANFLFLALAGLIIASI